ncbi:MAG: hypothetical protein WD872_10105 [Pirellulaceae bacterium]
MTTLMIDDELGQQASRAAAAQGKTLDEFVGEVLRQAVSGPTVDRTTRNGLPVIQLMPATPIDPLLIQSLLEEDGF